MAPWVGGCTVFRAHRATTACRLPSAPGRLPPATVAAVATTTALPLYRRCRHPKSDSCFLLAARPTRTGKLDHAGLFIR